LYARGADPSEVSESRKLGSGRATVEGLGAGALHFRYMLLAACCLSLLLLLLSLLLLLLILLLLLLL
jgi:hypothetical protein